MSLPTPGAPMSGGSINPFDAIMMGINSNPYLIGMTVLLLNMGGRFISMELSKGQEAVFQNPWVRRFLIFFALFMGTRNVLVAFYMSVIIILCLGYLFNENSSLCIFNVGAPGSTCAAEAKEGLAPSAVSLPPTAPNALPSALTPEEQDIYRKLHEKMMRTQPLNGTPVGAQSSSEQGASSEDDSSLKKIITNYWENMSFLRNEGFTNPRF